MTGPFLLLWLALGQLGGAGETARALPWGFAAPDLEFGSGGESSSTADLVESALDLMGTRYRRGGQSPKTGLDCASFVRWIFRPFGIDLPYFAAAQMTAGSEVRREELRAGDLVFFRDTYKRGISHVGLYLGENRFIHAAGRGRGVIISSLASRYYSRHFAGARRLLEHGGR